MKIKKKERLKNLHNKPPFNERVPENERFDNPKVGNFEC